MTDSFSDHAISLDSPATHGFEITPDDDTDLQAVTRFVYVGFSGDLEVILADDELPITLANLLTGYHPIRVKRVLATGTSASQIVGFK